MNVERLKSVTRWVSDASVRALAVFAFANLLLGAFSARWNANDLWIQADVLPSWFVQGLVVLFAVWSLVAIKRAESFRVGAVALFTCFFVAFVILTYFATIHRGPNWEFYAWPTMWPTH